MADIKVIIDWNDYTLTPQFSEVMAECWVVAKLKNAGIPVDGTLVFRGVREGKLTTWRDVESPNLQHFEWAK